MTTSASPTGPHHSDDSPALDHEGPSAPGEAAPEATDGRPRTGAALPSGRAIGVWLILTALAVAIDGLVGGLTLVVIAAVVLAGLSTRILGAIGVAALLAVPVVLLIRGLPTGDDLSPAFVYSSLVPHHLTFAGLILVSASALFDMAPHLSAWAAGEVPTQDDGPPLGTVLGAVAVGVIAVGALLACRAVLGA